jgi:hypothetical protein
VVSEEGQGKTDEVVSGDPVAAAAGSSSFDRSTSRGFLVADFLTAAAAAAAATAGAVALLTCSASTISGGGLAVAAASAAVFILILSCHTYDTEQVLSTTTVLQL